MGSSVATANPVMFQKVGVGGCGVGGLEGWGVGGWMVGGWESHVRGSVLFSDVIVTMSGVFGSILYLHASSL